MKGFLAAEVRFHQPYTLLAGQPSLPATNPATASEFATVSYGLKVPHQRALVVSKVHVLLFKLYKVTRNTGRYAPQFLDQLIQFSFNQFYLLSGKSMICLYIRYSNTVQTISGGHWWPLTVSDSQSLTVSNCQSVTDSDSQSVTVSDSQ